MTRSRDLGAADDSQTSLQTQEDLEWIELMTGADDLTPEQLARIRAENAHLEEGYNPTSSLFPDLGI